MGIPLNQLIDSFFWTQRFTEVFVGGGAMAGYFEE